MCVRLACRIVGGPGPNGGGVAMPVSGVDDFERFFRAVASLDVDKNDLKRFEDFLDRKVADLLLRGVANAKANARDVIELFDLPITKGLQESIHVFDKLDAELALRRLLAPLIARPPLDIALSDEAQDELPRVAGGVSVALARTFPVLDPEVRNPSSEHWERAFRVFDLLL
jgi:hypothetical protein